MYVGIDPSLTNTAVCVINENECVSYVQSKDLKLKSTMPFHRLREIVNMVLTALPSDGDIHVCYEDYSYGSTGKVFQLGELGGVLKLALYDVATTLTLIPPKVLKKFATLDGSCSKEDIQIKAAQECPLLLGESDDVCDAYFLAKFALFIHNKEKACTTNDLVRHRLEEAKRGKFITYNCEV